MPSVKAPPSSGPAIEAIPHTTPNSPNTTGLFGRATALLAQYCDYGYLPDSDMMTSPPENIPATPIPATALPTMRTTLDGATAQINEPISNSTTAPRKPHFTFSLARLTDSLISLPLYSRQERTLKIRYMRPKEGCSAVLVRKYALPYHPTSSIL